MSNERNELEAAYALRDILQRNYLVRSGPKGKSERGRIVEYGNEVAIIKDTDTSGMTVSTI